ncbi:hypothetical protein U1Q18_043744 [Sarracenia purpurea var. burkii]
MGIDALSSSAAASFGAVRCGLEVVKVEKVEEMGLSAVLARGSCICPCIEAMSEAQVQGDQLVLCTCLVFYAINPVCVAHPVVFMQLRLAEAWLYVFSLTQGSYFLQVAWVYVSLPQPGLVLSEFLLQVGGVYRPKVVLNHAGELALNVGPSITGGVGLVRDLYVGDSEAFFPSKSQFV